MNSQFYHLQELVDDASVEEGHRGQQQKIKLDHCLQAFTMEEELGRDELYHCGKCKKPQLAKKKLDIWRLPPVLVRYALALFCVIKIFYFTVIAAVEIYILIESN